MNHLTPQQRWQKFRDERIPKLSNHEQRFVVAAIIVVIGFFTACVLPFILPLTGPATRDPHMLADPDGAFIHIDNQQLYYIHRAAPDATVLFLHGQGGSTQSWQETMPVLHNAGYNVYAIDLPGAGLSEKGLDLNYGHPAQTELIIQFMDAQSIDRTHLVAHAFSGNIALMIAQLYPTRVNKVALVAPTIITWDPPQVPSDLLSFPVVERWTRVLMQLVVPEAVGELLRSATKIDEVVTDDLIDDYSRPLHTEGWDLAAIGMARDSHLNKLPYPLASIEAPVLLLWGTDDGWAPPEQADDLEAAIPNIERTEFNGVGHLPMHEAPDDFNAALINFFDN